MSQILTPGDRQDAWGTIGDLRRRVAQLEANLTCCVPDAPGSLADLILANPCLAAFWKANEASGTAAADSSGNGWSLTSTGLVAPTWGQAAIVGSDTAAGFATQGGAPPQALKHTTFPDLDTGDFTALIFGRRSGLTHDPMLGQGTGVFGGGNGWGLWTAAFNEGSGNKLVVTKAPSNPLEGTTSWLSGETHMGAVTFQVATNTWTLYMDGAAEATEVDAWTGTTGIWLGAADFTATTEQYNGDLAYAAIFTCALSTTQIDDMWQAFSNPDTIPDGYVLTADSSAPSGWSWQPSTIEVEW